MRTGTRLGVDVGSVRVGVARSDPAGLLATPLLTLRRGRGDLAQLADLVREHEAVEVVVGLPRTLSGREGPAAATAVDYARRVARRLPSVVVRLVDERLSTVGAQRGLHEVGVDTRRGRKVIDQAAAVIILQGALDAERATGTPPGRVVRPDRTQEGQDGAVGPGEPAPTSKEEE
jgi:putative Holliday junction resolvase